MGYKRWGQIFIKIYKIWQDISILGIELHRNTRRDLLRWKRRIRDLNPSMKIFGLKGDFCYMEKRYGPEAVGTGNTTIPCRPLMTWKVEKEKGTDDLSWTYCSSNKTCPRHWLLRTWKKSLALAQEGIEPIPARLSQATTTRYHT